MQYASFYATKKKKKRRLTQLSFTGTKHTAMQTHTDKKMFTSLAHRHPLTSASVEPPYEVQ